MSSQQTLDTSVPATPQRYLPNDAMGLPQGGSRDEWLIGREEVSAQERAAVRRRDAVQAQRHRVSMTKLDKAYVFEGPGGKSTLVDLFADLRRLLVCHFLLEPGASEGCSSCSAAAQEISADLLARLRARDTSFVAVSRAPLDQIQRYQARTGWVFPWYSCLGSDFHHDFHTTPDDSAAPTPSNDHSAQPARSVYLREGSRLFHTYSMFAHRTENLDNCCYRLDLTARRQQH